MSCGVTREMAVPLRPALAVLPTRCTYVVALLGKSWLITNSTAGMSSPGTIRAQNY